MRDTMREPGPSPLLDENQWHWDDFDLMVWGDPEPETPEPDYSEFSRAVSKKVSAIVLG